MFAKSKKFIAPLVVLIVACMAVEAAPVQQTATYPQSCICSGVQSGDDTAATKTICNALAPPNTVDGQEAPMAFDGHACVVQVELSYLAFDYVCTHTAGIAGTSVCSAV
ncbi:hypothetical protein BGZ98_010158 [Dissophora globulifera]|uniref:Secreted protein n=1 Tax=Dissophora globulifera TaxID=979702 RepID=A0A9P6URM1_9FUNG|nr:hypothetical protein BGZ98_010158 [Dissophora globulifera]KAG0317778.1 hypothetical protein BGZ99_006106 [Dissophora globulifera]